jgi:hypothetical protein
MMPCIMPSTAQLLPLLGEDYERKKRCINSKISKEGGFYP